MITWSGPAFAVDERSTSDPKLDLWAAHPKPTEDFCAATCDFFKKVHSGKLIFYCDASFSRPQTTAFRLAVRVKAAWNSGDPLSGRFFLEGFLVRANYFFSHARAHAEMMLKNSQLGLVLDLDKTLILAEPGRSLGQQIEQSNEPERLQRLRDGTFVALRVGVKHMLESTGNKNFEMHVFCNGSLSYAKEVLRVFDLQRYFGARITSGRWTTSDQLCFGLSGCKDFRSIFDFHRYPQYQEMVVAVDGRDFTQGNQFSFKHSKLKRDVYAEVVIFCKHAGSQQSGGTIYYQQLPKQFYPTLVPMSLDRLVIDQKKLGFQMIGTEAKCTKYCANELARRSPL